MPTYPHLLSPLRIAGTTLPNRMVMGAMHTRLETLDRPHERLAAFWSPASGTSSTSTTSSCARGSSRTERSTPAWPRAA
jgi:2,4-dienoyl-CoA reductase-like NADH-dependent reductase (Old Yellow Enzyme family)